MKIFNGSFRSGNYVAANMQKLNEILTQRNASDDLRALLPRSTPWRDNTLAQSARRASAWAKRFTKKINIVDADVAGFELHLAAQDSVGKQLSSLVFLIGFVFNDDESLAHLSVNVKRSTDTWDSTASEKMRGELEAILENAQYEYNSEAWQHAWKSAMLSARARSCGAGLYFVYLPAAANLLIQFVDIANELGQLCFYADSDGKNSNINDLLANGFLEEFQERIKTLGESFDRKMRASTAEAQIELLDQQWEFINRELRAATDVFAALEATKKSLHNIILAKTDSTRTKNFYITPKGREELRAVEEILENPNTSQEQRNEIEGMDLFQILKYVATNGVAYNAEEAMDQVTLEAVQSGLIEIA